MYMYMYTIDILHTHTCTCNFRNVAALVGAGYVLRLAISELYRLAGGFRAYFLAPWGISGVNLKKYGEWAGRPKCVALQCRYCIVGRVR